MGLTELAKAEIRLRIGVCFDCVKKLKNALGVRSFLTRHSQHQHGYGQATRAQSAIRRAEGVVRLWGRQYRQSWAALDRLGVSEDGRLGLQRLDDGHLTMLGRWLEAEEYRYNGEQLPWIWTLAPLPERDGGEGLIAAVESWKREGAGNSADFKVQSNHLTVSILVLRLEWVHATAVVNRWEEELRLLKEESRRLPVSFRQERDHWILNRDRYNGGELSEEAQGGFKAYACQQAAQYELLASEADRYQGQILTFSHVL